MKTLYIYPSKGNDIPFTLVDIDNGEALASHFCSHEGFAPGDLYYARPERIEKYKEKYQDDVEVKFFDEQSEVSEDELFARNKRFSEEWEKEHKGDK